VRLDFTKGQEVSCSNVGGIKMHGQSDCLGVLPSKPIMHDFKHSQLLNNEICELLNLYSTGIQRIVSMPGLGSSTGEV